MENYDYWVANSKDEDGCKTEHVSPDPRQGSQGTTAFIQTSTCGYFGHIYVNDVAAALAAAGGDFPASFDATYHVYQGETDVTSLIKLGGKGQYAEGRDGMFIYGNE